MAVSPRGNFIVTGGKDQKVRIYDFADVEKENPSFDAPAPVTAVAFNPKSHWIAVGTEVGWAVWDFESKDTPTIADGEFKLEKVVQTQTESKKVKPTKYHQVTSVSWNTLGTRLFVGYSNGDVKVHEITEEKLN